MNIFYLSEFRNATNVLNRELDKVRPVFFDRPVKLLVESDVEGTKAARVDGAPIDGSSARSETIIYKVGNELPNIDYKMPQLRERLVDWLEWASGPELQCDQPQRELICYYIKQLRRKVDSYLKLYVTAATVGGSPGDADVTYVNQQTNLDSTSTTDKAATEFEPTADHVKVMKAMAANPCSQMKLLRAKTRMSERTLQRRVKDLEEVDFAHRPRGRNNGLGLTRAGRELLEKVEQTATTK
ncbi:MAG: hypothetical protein KDB23_22780 [Planctomycetales bacterium]|nr:hypothetical protein [Planctomycetales bacterium]